MEVLLLFTSLQNVVTLWTVVVVVRAIVKSTKVICPHHYVDIRALYLCDFLKNRFYGHSTFVMQTIDIIIYHSFMGWTTQGLHRYSSARTVSWAERPRDCTDTVLHGQLRQKLSNSWRKVRHVWFLQLTESETCLVSAGQQVKDVWRRQWVVWLVETRMSGLQRVVWLVEKTRASAWSSASCLISREDTREWSSACLISRDMHDYLHISMYWLNVLSHTDAVRMISYFIVEFNCKERVSCD